jgi:hypothetical protein
VEEVNGEWEVQLERAEGRFKLARVKWEGCDYEVTGKGFVHQVKSDGLRVTVIDPEHRQAVISVLEAYLRRTPSWQK